MQALKLLVPSAVQALRPRVGCPFQVLGETYCGEQIEKLMKEAAVRDFGPPSLEESTALGRSSVGDT